MKTDPRSWEEGAACYGKESDPHYVEVMKDLKIKSVTELFYPPRAKSKYHVFANHARSLCFGPDGRHPCPVRRQCLSWAIKQEEEHGIFGGLSHRERNALVRKCERNDVDVHEHIADQPY